MLHILFILCISTVYGIQSPIKLHPNPISDLGGVAFEILTCKNLKLNYIFLASPLETSNSYYIISFTSTYMTPILPIKFHQILSMVQEQWPLQEILTNEQTDRQEERIVPILHRHTNNFGDCSRIGSSTKIAIIYVIAETLWN